MNYLPLIWVYFTAIAYSFVEVYRDKGIAKVSDVDSVRTILENHVIHSMKAPQRVLFGLLAASSGLLMAFLIFQKDFSWVIVVFIVGLYPFVFWGAINIVCAKWWLKKPWDYVGSTSEMDEAFVKPHHIYIPVAAGLSVLYMLWVSVI